MSASLKVGLATGSRTEAVAALITLVDLPGLPLAAVLRMLGSTLASTAAAETVAAGRAAVGRGSPELALRQAIYRGRPGHPVLIGRAHWPALAEQLTDDEGARRYLDANHAERIDCSDLWDGSDIDIDPVDTSDG